MRKRCCTGSRCRSPPSTTLFTSSPTRDCSARWRVDGSKTYFDTNTSDHHHFFVEDDNEVFDIPVGVDVTKLPEPPPGYEISRVDVVVRLRRVKSRG